MKTRSKTENLIADICLYGNHTTGAGWLAQVRDGRMLGTGDPVRSRGFTEAVWLAADEIRALGFESGIVRIFASGGQWMAKADIAKTIPYFGSLKWEAAPVYEISAEAIVAATEQTN